MEENRRVYEKDLVPAVFGGRVGPRLAEYLGVQPWRALGPVSLLLTLLLWLILQEKLINFVLLLVGGW